MNPHDHGDQLLAGEDWARADFYGLLSVLMSGKVDDAFLARFRDLDRAQMDITSPIGFEFSELIRHVVNLDAREVIAEHNDCFIGVGKPDVMLYGSYYMAGFLNEKPLVALRTDLAKFGLTRDESMVETEDHIAFLCEVMRYLILADDPPVSFDQQRLFFHTHIAPWYGRLADAIEQCGSASFYKTVGRLMRVFLDVEAQSFDFESAV
ncbi:molecular chaperone TorD family protein [Limnobacter humi]|uniref:Molecular chaperone TorD family protein n=1 Tax=Limnobacter humi TaxID=1778671 RepID=A0ABT1WEG0_9BURK|nr:molecular chaperone TorD family protein [Limnobacter humi]MCQ8895906.1 molecular chaperone TorD family protein [Limnobacter humi]